MDHCNDVVPAIGRLRHTFRSVVWHYWQFDFLLRFFRFRKRADAHVQYLNWLAVSDTGGNSMPPSTALV
jgi:hypothetical protein